MGPISASPPRPTLARYPGYNRWLMVLVLALLVPAVPAEWDSTCPTNCRCTYASNRKVVKCQNAGYSTLPSSLSPEVQEVDLSRNLIKQLDSKEFQEAGLVNLQLLDLSHNHISYVDRDAFSGLSILIELSLEHNRIDRLHQLTFTGMDKLRKLVLSHNQLTRLDAHQFPPLHHLRTLKLDGNHIDYVHHSALAALPNLTALELSSNALRGVEPEVFTPTGKLVSLELSSNPWVCDCHLRDFARWLAASQTLGKTNWNCHAPDRLKDLHWTEVSLEDFACDPVVSTSKKVVSLVLGSHGALRCWAQGDPMPTFKWVAERKILSNMSSIGNTDGHFAVVTVSNETGVYSTLDLGVFSEVHPTSYSCIAENNANSVAKSIEVVVGASDPLDVIVNSGTQLWVLVVVGGVLIVLVVILIVLVLCCWCRRRRDSKTPSGKLGGENVLVVAPHSSQVNPVVKPQRQYEQLPQKDIEMTSVSTGEVSGHPSFDEFNYPANNHSIYSDRSRLPPVEEETPMVVGGLYAPLTYPQRPSPPCPSPCLTIQSNTTQQTTASHYPDILDNVRIPRTISPTQMSYQSLAYPPPLGADWRFSYALPGDYSGGYPPEHTHSPVAYSTPQHHRPGYVTLPRRPRAPSWNGVPSPPLPVLSPTVPPAIYDTLGPRTTADGTSTTDLTRPGSRAGLYEPLPPGTGVVTPTSPLALAAHYTASASRPRHTPQRGSQTLPRSTPNLLDDPTSSRRRPADVYSKADVHASEIEPLIEDPHLGIPYAPQRGAPPSDPVMNQSFLNNNNNNNTSKNNNDSASTTPQLSPTPSQMLSNAPEASPNKNPQSEGAPSLTSEGEPVSPGLPQGGAGETGPPKKKVPPKPPPKPSKRLSVASTASDGGAVRQTPVLTTYEDNGPDGSEV